MKILLFGGIDPGSTGGLSVVDEQETIIEAIPMPMIGKEVDIDAVYDFFAQYHNEDFELKLLIEKVNSNSFGDKMGGGKRSGGGKLMKNVGLLSGKIHSLCGYEEISPKRWQNHMLAGESENTKIGKGVKTTPEMKKKIKELDTKTRALIVAKRKYPNVTFFASDRCSKPHDGIIDSILIACYGRRRFMGGAL